MCRRDPPPLPLLAIQAFLSIFDIHYSFLRHFACATIQQNVQLFLLPATNVVLACCHSFLFINIDSKGNICGEEENACLDLIILVIADVVANPRPTHKVTIGLDLRVQHLKNAP